MPFDRRHTVIIGSGNVAHHIGHALKRSDNRLLRVIGRNAEAAERLAFSLGCRHSTDFGDIPEEADTVIIAVRDAAIAEVAGQLFCPGKTVVHTSGTIPMAALGDCSDRLGVFYPLQTLHKDAAVDFSTVPLCIEANSKWTEGYLLELARSLSRNVQAIDSEQRKMAHLAAVFACNFSNHCYTLANQLLENNGMTLDILRPLIAQTAANVQGGKPSTLQTGPAQRGDSEVMAEHLRMLQSEHPGFSELYRWMSDSIAQDREN